jgi:murein DD-endopeptidase MepM/ murein hydrolase activator NlpD
MTDEKPKKTLIKRLRSRYFFILRKEENFEERLSVRFSLASLLSITGGLIVLLILIVISLVAFTPLREYIPGYADINVRKDLLSLNIKADSLQLVLQERNDYIRNIRRLLSDSAMDDSSSFSHQAQPDTILAKHPHPFSPPSQADSILRSEVESQNPYNVALGAGKDNSNSISSYFFFTPLKGIITNGFNPVSGHYGVDITSKENEAIKATLDGTIILSAWTLATGNVIIIQHANNLVSVYAHNSVLLKKTGENVTAGDVIAIVGNTGELTSGPHLHFELWYEGNAVNPVDYMSF